MAGPLAGVRIADFSEYIAAPIATMLLADLGADVVKVEPPGGDRWRQSLPLGGGEGRGFLQANRNKRSIVLDLKCADARTIAHELVRRSDVAVVNARQEVVRRLRIDYETLAVVNPSLIYCQNTGFGTSGPYAHRGGFDLLGQSAAGIILYEGSVNNGSHIGVAATALGDFSAGLFMAYGILAALFARSQGAGGQRIDTSLLDAAVASQYRPLFSVERRDAERRQEFLGALDAAIEAGADVDQLIRLRAETLGQRIENVYYRPYRTRDGAITVACLNNDLRRRLRDLLCIEDPSIDEWGYRGPTPEQAEATRAAVEAAFLEKTTAEWMEILDRVGVPCGPLNAPEQVFDDPQVRANGAMLQLEHPVVGPIRMPANPVRMSGTPLPSATPPPVLGSSTRAVLKAAEGVVVCRDE
jgi:crotonobetainyl-CoA:carnitine CoA-transferase CaiB-like acyl-CoA transferase